MIAYQEFRTRSCKGEWVGNLKIYLLYPKVRHIIDNINFIKELEWKLSLGNHVFSLEGL